MGYSAVVRKVGDVAIVDLEGRLTLGEDAGLMRNTVRRLLESGERRIVLNLAKVSYLDSAAGIGELVGVYTTAACNSAQLKLLHAGKNVNYVLRIAGLHRVFEIHDDEDAVIQSFHQSERATAS